MHKKHTHTHEGRKKRILVEKKAAVQEERIIRGRYVHNTLHTSIELSTFIIKEKMLVLC